ncbi:MAG TPA: MazG family protein [Actinomycetota bacterium]|nr:MazG family protein [Actinomycetota bacterium]
MPLAPDQTELLTLGEWEQLVAAGSVAFERSDHPLRDRLEAVGVYVSSFTGSLRDEGAFVVDPDSDRIVELARSGARISPGSGTPPDDLAAAHGAPVALAATAALTTLVQIMARLRSEDGCPWDREQTHASLSVHLLEEAYEVVDSIDRDQLGRELAEELGDVLLQVVFHSRLAEQDGRFNVASVARAISDKLVRRHPHVFGDVEVSGADEVVTNWETLKAAEKDGDAVDELPTALPALLAAHKTFKRAARLGWQSDAPLARQEARALLDSDEPLDVGELLLRSAALATALGVDPEAALRGALRRFRESL